MKRNGLIVLVASVALVLVMVLSGCGNGATPTPSGIATPTPTYSGPTPTPRVEIQTVEVEKEYRAMNPAGIFIPVETVGLSQRLDSFDGKTIYVIQGEADPVIMPALAQELPREYPNGTFVYYNPSSSFGSSRPDDTTISEADAAIRGIGW